MGVARLVAVCKQDTTEHGFQGHRTQLTAPDPHLSLSFTLYSYLHLKSTIVFDT
jgi:hypothetical protein